MLFRSHVLTKLRDPGVTSAEEIVRVIESGEIGDQYGSFRGCMDGSWLSSSPEPMTWQRSGDFARVLRERGVRSIILGDLSEEWYLYSIAHTVNSMHDIADNLERYYQKDFVTKAMAVYPTLPDGSSNEEFQKLFGQILSDAQVHLPVRLLARDLADAGFPVLRYQIRWTPEQVRPLGSSSPLYPISFVT